MATPKWTEDRVTKLQSLVGQESPVSAATVNSVATELETSTRSVAAKLRREGYEVASVSKASTKSFSEDQTEELTQFLQANSGQYTYAEVATQVCGGAFSAKAIQGKALSLELTGAVKPTPKTETQKKYSEAEEAQFLELAASGAFLEDIAKAMDRPLASVRGKALALRNSQGIDMPKQRESYANAKQDVLEGIDNIGELTVEDIAEKTGKSERGIKVMLTHRGIKCANHDGEAKRAKADAKKAG